MMYDKDTDMIDRIMSMFATVQNEHHGSVWLVFILGVLFGSIIQFTKVHKFEKIAGFAMLQDTVVPKMLFLAIGISSIGLYVMVQLGWASYHIKPIILGGLIIGGVIFGISMAIFGKCPGTGPISVAEGRIDIMVGALGGILGGLVFTLYYDKLKLIMGPNLGKSNLPAVLDHYQGAAVLLFGIFMIALSIFIPLKEEIDHDDPGYKEAK